MTKTTAEKRARFRTLHETGCFVLPNPWDAGSARMFQHLGFEALASTSSGYAWSTGQADHGVARADVLRHLAVLCKAVDLPVNADFESCFAADLDELAESVRLVIGTGVAGFSIEDRDVANARLYDKPTALARLHAARQAIDQSGENVVLVARTEILLSEPGEVSAAIDKLVAFAAAGADCLFAPGVKKKDDIRAMVKAVAPKPLNVLAMDYTMPVAEMAELGVRRISVGGALARAGWAAAVAAAKSLKDGSFAPLADGTSGRELNTIFDAFPKET